MYFSIQILGGESSKIDMKLIGPSTHCFVSDAARLLCQSVNQEFGDLLDCIWKFNEQIEELRKIELGKLNTDSPSMAKSRITNASRKLGRSFPLFLNYSFTSTSYSLLEVYLRRICDSVKEYRGLEESWRDMKGNSRNIIEKAYRYLEKTCGIERTKICGFVAVDTMGLIRHCIVHVAGFLDGYKNRTLLEERIAKQECFLGPHRKTNYVMIKDLGEGPRLWFGLDYTQLSCAYGRGFLNELFVESGLATSR